MKFKRLMALALAGVMTLAMAGSAFADPEGTDAGNENPTVTETNDAQEDAQAVETYPLKDYEIIEKKVVCEEAVKLHEDATFTFKFTPDKNNPDEVKIEDKTLTVSAGTGKTADATAENKYPGTLGVKITETFSTPGLYVYTIEEDKTGTTVGDWTYNPGKDKYTLRIYKEFNKEPQCTIEKVGGSKTEHASFTNEYRPVSGGKDGTSLTVKKDAKGEEYSKVDEYDFKVSFGFTSLNPVAENMTYKIGEQGENKPVSANTTFKLKKGDTVYFTNIPEGITYTVVEENADKAHLGNYFQECEDTNKNATGKLTKETINVVLTNIFDAPTPTGLAISVAPFIAMFAAVGAAIALYVAAKRRVR